VDPEADCGEERVAGRGRLFGGRDGSWYCDVRWKERGISAS